VDCPKKKKPDKAHTTQNAGVHQCCNCILISLFYLFSSSSSLSEAPKPAITGPPRPLPLPEGPPRPPPALDGIAIFDLPLPPIPAGRLLTPALKLMLMPAPANSTDQKGNIACVQSAEPSPHRSTGAPPITYSRLLIGHTQSQAHILHQIH